jgi:hypothetical protein
MGSGRRESTGKNTEDVRILRQELPFYNPV